MESEPTSEVTVEAEPNLDVEAEAEANLQPPPESADAAIASFGPSAPKLPDSTGTLDVDEDDVVSEQPVTEPPSRPNVTSVPMPEGDEPLELRAAPHTPARTADDVATELVHYLHQEGITVQAARLYQRTIDERPVAAPPPAPEVAEASKAPPAPTTEPNIEIEPSSAAATGDRPLAASASPAADARGSTPASEAAPAREDAPSRAPDTTAVRADVEEASEADVEIEAQRSTRTREVNRSTSTVRPTAPDASTDSPSVEVRSADTLVVDASTKAPRAPAAGRGEARAARAFDAPAEQPAIVADREDAIDASNARTAIVAAPEADEPAPAERAEGVAHEETTERAPNIAERAHGVAPRRAVESEPSIEALAEAPRAPAEVGDDAAVDATRVGRPESSVAADAPPERPIVDARREAFTPTDRATLDPNPGVPRKANDAAIDASPDAPNTNERVTTSAPRPEAPSTTEGVTASDPRPDAANTNERVTTSDPRPDAPSSNEGVTASDPRPDAANTTEGVTASDTRPDAATPTEGETTSAPRPDAPRSNEAANVTSREGSTTTHAEAGSRPAPPETQRPQTESRATPEPTTQTAAIEPAQDAGSLERPIAARLATKDPVHASTGTGAAADAIEAPPTRPEPSAPHPTQELAAPKPRPASPPVEAPPAVAAQSRATERARRPTVVAELVDHAHRVTLDADTNAAAAAAERTTQSTPAPATGAAVSTPAVTVESPPEIAVDSAEDVEIEIEEIESERAATDEPERAASPLRADAGATGGEDRPAAHPHPTRARPDVPVEVAAEGTFAATFVPESTEATLRQDPARPSEQVARAHRLFAEARELARRQTMSSFRRLTIDLPVDQGAPVRLTITPDHQGHHRVALVAATHAVRAELERHRHELEEIVEAFPLDVTELSIDASPRAREDLRAFDERISNHGNQRPERR